MFVYQRFNEIFVSIYKKSAKKHYLTACKHCKSSIIFLKFDGKYPKNEVLLLQPPGCLYSYEQLTGIAEEYITTRMVNNKSM
jgi:hypothetical protein